jgi:hypothetical protein
VVKIRGRLKNEFIKIKIKIKNKYETRDILGIVCVRGGCTGN